MEKSAMVQRINANNKKLRRHQLAENVFEFFCVGVAIATLIGFMFLGHGLGIH